MIVASLSREALKTSKKAFLNYLTSKFLQMIDNNDLFLTGRSKSHGIDKK